MSTVGPRSIPMIRMPTTERSLQSLLEFKIAYGKFSIVIGKKKQMFMITKKLKLLEVNY